MLKLTCAVLGTLTLIPSLALADGSIAGKVEATPPKYLEETVVFVKDAKVAASPTTRTMDQKQMKFIPHVLAVTQGDTVDFLNHDGVDHNVFTPDGEAYNLGMIKKDGKSSFTFTKTGAYSQLCSIHPEMLGYIYVAPNKYHAAVDAKGTFNIEHVPAGTYTLAIWNSHLKGAEQTVTVAEGKPAEANFSLKR
jgi:plastocyanin